MRQLVRALLCLQKTEGCSMQDVLRESKLSESEVEELIAPYPEVFVREGSTLHYSAPYGIVDKASAHEAVRAAEYRGLRCSDLKLCYEFAARDVRELIEVGRAVSYAPGKADELLVFAASRERRVPGFAALWKSV